MWILLLLMILGNAYSQASKETFPWLNSLDLQEYFLSHFSKDSIDQLHERSKTN